MATTDRRGATVSAADPPIGTNPNPDLAIKAPVRVATTGSNINLQTIGLGTLDGIALAAGDRVLVKDQTDQTTNGLYNATTGPWTRTIDANNNSQWARGVQVLVTDGATNPVTTWQCSSPTPITLGTSLITFARPIPLPVGNVPINVASFPFLAKGDGVTDDTIAIQAAINFCATQGGGTILIPAGSIISNTLTITGKNHVRLIGLAWGISTFSPPVSFLKWNGTSGIPMVKDGTFYGAHFENLRFIGKSTSKPSCAIQFDSTTNDCTHNTATRVWIGQMAGNDTDANNQFTNGILFTGTVNGDTNNFRHIVIAGCDQSGVYVQNPQAAGNNFDGLWILNCAVGVRTASYLNVTSAVILGSTTADWQLDTGGKAYVTAYHSELSAKCVFYNSGVSFFSVRGGSWQAGANIAASGKFIDTNDVFGFGLNLEDFDLTFVDGYSGPTPLVSLFNHSGSISNGYARIVGCGGILPANLSLGTMVFQNDNRMLEYRPAPTLNQDPLTPQDIILDWNSAEDQTYKPARNHLAGQLNNYGGPVKVKQLATIASVTVTPTGAGATTYAYRVTALTYDGETLPSTEVTCTNGPLSVSVFNTISWTPIQGAQAYKVYGRTSGAEQLLITRTFNDLHPGNGTILPTPPTTWVDTGSLSPSGAMPSANTTGNVSVGGSFTSGVLCTSQSGVGYATGLGAGSTVAQTTNKSTTVVINAITGQITMNNATLNAGAIIVFAVANASVAATDVIIVNIASGATIGAYNVVVTKVASNQFDITMQNISAGNLSEAVVLNFAVIKGAAS